MFLQPNGVAKGFKIEDGGEKGKSGKIIEQRVKKRKEERYS